ncbi:hypothetical protein I4U23_016098 [Adineta vaga]|nr:hypothetical protein I4U23_016098 [Adineta vaga]
MTGIPRTLYKEEVYVAYRRQALNNLPGDLFLILQLPDKAEKVHGVEITVNHRDSYESAIKYLSPKRLQWIPISDNIGVKDDITGYAKWKRCLDHIEQAEKENGFQYDFIVRTRPDIFIAKDLPTEDLLPHDRVLINPYYECLLDDIPPGYTKKWSDHQSPCDNKNYGLSDFFTILPRKFANIFLNISYIPDLPRHICGSRSSHPECGVRAILFKYNITFELWPFVVKIMRPTQFCHNRVWNHFNSWC